MVVEVVVEAARLVAIEPIDDRRLLLEAGRDSGEAKNPTAGVAASSTHTNARILPGADAPNISIPRKKDVGVRRGSQKALRR